MTHVITDTCTLHCETECADVCPVDAIHASRAIAEIRATPRELRRSLGVIQLFIDPEQCICCAACEPECPVGAIFESEDVPVASRAAIAANEAFFRERRGV